MGAPLYVVRYWGPVRGEMRNEWTYKPFDNYNDAKEWADSWGDNSTVYSQERTWE